MRRFGFRESGKAFTLAALALAGLTFSAQGGVTVGALSVSTDMGQQWGSIDGIINQGGLSANYVNGVTDFDAFVASTTHSPSFNSTWLSGASVTSGNIDFDMGSPVTLGGLAMWANGQPAGLILEYVHNFEIYSSSDASFTSPVLVGTFSLNTTFGNDADPGHAFTFDSSVTTQYLRMRVLDTQIGSNWTTAIDEVVFNSVPAPNAAALLGMGGVLMSRRRRNPKG